MTDQPSPADPSEEALAIAEVADGTQRRSGPDTPETQVGGIDAKFTLGEYRAMLEEVRQYLPAFLSPAASEHHDPVGDTKELLDLEDKDLARVLAVHVCLSDETTLFAEALARGMRRPHTSTERPEEITQAVRGPIDWGATTRRRSLTGWDPSVFVVRPGQRIFNTPENQALAWAIHELEVALSGASLALSHGAADTPADGWKGRLAMLAAALRGARRVEWLREVAPRRPTARVRQRIAATRTAFYRSALGDIVSLLLRADDPDAETLTEILCSRYFEPHKAWKLFEVLVALRLAREFAKPEHSKTLRRTRLLAGGEEVQAYARYGLSDNGEVQLTFQKWPARKGPSVRQETAKRHGFTPKPSIPDLFLTRTDAAGQVVDAVVLELKATKNPGYLGEGLSQLLSYLGERPGLLGHAPSGWLVAPPSNAFKPADPPENEALWVVAANEVAQHAAKRLAH